MKQLNRKFLLNIALGSVLIFLTNCVTVQGNYAFLSEKEIDFSKDYEKKPEQIKAEYSISHIIFPLGDTRASRLTAEVIQKACTDNNLEYLTNTQINETYYYFFLYGEIKYELTGDGWIEKVPPAKKGK